MPENTLTLFCDEAGNTGIDLTGQDQPFFVAAGYLVPAERIPACRDAVESLRARVSAERKMEVGELKASSLLGSARGRNAIADFLPKIEQAGAVPILIAIEKSFSLGGRFVDDFLDLGDNPRAGPEFSVDRDTKRAAATAIAESSSATLKAIEAALRNPTREVRHAAVLAVTEDLKRRGLPDLAYITEGVLLSPDGLDPPEHSDLSFPDFASANAPNPTSLISLITAADRYAADHGVEAVNFVHDDTKYMEAALKHAYWVVTDPGVYERLSTTPFLDWPDRVERVLPPSFVRSETEPLVQAADLLAGGVAHWLKRGYRRERLDSSTRLIAEVTLTIFMDGRMPGAGAVFSDNAPWLGEMSRQLNHSALRKALPGPFHD